MQSKKVICFLGLGTNLGDKMTNLSVAISAIQDAGVEMIEKSKIYQTPPWGFDAKEDFYNMVVKVRTQLSPFQLLVELKAVELRMGRKSKSMQGYSSRIIDLDIIDYGSEIIDLTDLQIPHPHLAKRLFVLQPLQDVDPDYIHPKTSQEIHVLIADLKKEDITIVNNSPL